MTGDDLKRFRERRGLDRQELADLINGSLDKRYNSETISRWERGVRNTPRTVAAFLGNLQVAGGLSGELPPLADAPLEPVGDDLGDTAPGPGPTAPESSPQLTFGTTGIYAKACTELWEMIAAGVGMIGAATNNPALMHDGEIIANDREALGQAWGKLAETNETFRRMLAGMTEGGAWLQVAMVTGTTVSKCWQGHVAYAESRISYPDAADPDTAADLAAVV